jgi:hypothetical protein
MVRFPFFSACLVLACCTASVPAVAQQDSTVADPHNARPVPQRVVPMPFPIAAGPLEIARSIQLRSPDTMSEPDRLLEADAESSIAERAGYSDIVFNQGKWSYAQLVCPALPNHLFLRFTRNNGSGDMSVFSAAIPRNGQGHVRIIPIQRRSYSLFSPAPINALTIAAFNRIRTEDESDKADETPGWLGTGLCYAALAGANPMAAQMNAMAIQDKYPEASSPILSVPPKGGADIRFTDMSARPRPMEWSLVFNGKGRLLKAAHAPAGIAAERAIPPTTADQNTRPIPPFQ